MQVIECMGVCNAKLIGSGKVESGDNMGIGASVTTALRLNGWGGVHKPA